MKSPRGVSRYIGVPSISLCETIFQNQIGGASLSEMIEPPEVHMCNLVRTFGVSVSADGGLDIFRYDFQV